MNASNIRGKFLLVAGLVLAIAASLWLADRNGFNRAMAKVEANNTKATAAAKEQQAIEQAGINDLAGLYHGAMQTLHDTQQELHDYKAELRSEQQKRRTTHDSTDCNCEARPPPAEPVDVLPAVYRMFNRAIQHPDLPENQRRQPPDAAGDGLDAVQYCGQESARLAIKVNTLQGIIRSSSCFVSSGRS